MTIVEIYRRQADNGGIFFHEYKYNVENMIKFDQI